MPTRHLSFVSTALTKLFFKSSKTKDVKQQQVKDFVIEDKKVAALCFSIYGPSDTAVDETKQYLEKHISDDLAFQCISDAMVYKLADKDRQRIQDLQRTMDLSVKIEQKADSDEVKLIVEGFSRDVLLAVGEINEMLKRTREEESKKENIERTAELVEWQYQQGGQYHSFDKDTNFQLEEALQMKNPQVDINFQNQVYRVKMPDGPAASVSGGGQTEIRRVDKTRGNFYNDCKNTCASICV